MAKHDMFDLDRQPMYQGLIHYLQIEAGVPRKGTKLLSTTVQRYVSTLKAFFSWLELEEYIQINPMNKIRVPRAPTEILNTFTPNQIAALIAA